MFKRSFALLASLFGSVAVAQGHGPSPMDLAVQRAKDSGVDFSPITHGHNKPKDRNSGRWQGASSHSVASDKRTARKSRNIAKRRAH